MSIDSQFRMKEPDEVLLEMTTTMTLKEWRALAEQIKGRQGDQYPAYSFYNQILRLVEQADAHFTERSA